MLGSLSCFGSKTSVHWDGRPWMHRMHCTTPGPPSHRFGQKSQEFVGDTAKRIIAKAILNVVRQDVQEAAGSVQLCAGQISAHYFFQREETEALLLVDASNAFNSLNRQTALRNIQRLCPSLATALINTYRSPSELYVGGDVLLSSGRNDPGWPTCNANVRPSHHASYWLRRWRTMWMNMVRRWRFWSWQGQ